MLNIIILEKVWKQDRYLELFHQEDLSFETEAYCKKYDFSVYTQKELRDLQRTINMRQNSSPTLKAIKGSIQKEITEKEKEERIHITDEIIAAANESQNKKFDSTAMQTLVENIVETNSTDKIKSLNSIGLSVLTDYFDEISSNATFKLLWPIETFYSNLLQYKKDDPISKWDIDFDSFLRSVKKCVPQKNP